MSRSRTLLSMATPDANPNTPTERAVTTHCADVLLATCASGCAELHLDLSYAAHVVTTGTVTGLAALVVDPLRNGNVTLLRLLDATGPMPKTLCFSASDRDPTVYLFAHALDVPLATRTIGAGLTLFGDGAEVPGPGSPTLSGVSYTAGTITTVAPLPLFYRIDWRGFGLITDTNGKDI